MQTYVSKQKKRFRRDALRRGNQMSLGFLFAQPFTQQNLDHRTEVH